MRADSKTKTIGNATLLGQIATFMGELGLTYEEVVYKLPYRNLILMQKDKLRECADKIEEVSEEEMGIKFVN